MIIFKSEVQLGCDMGTHGLGFRFTTHPLGNPLPGWVLGFNPTHPAWVPTGLPRTRHVIKSLNWVTHRFAKNPTRDPELH